MTTALNSTCRQETNRRRFLKTAVASASALGTGLLASSASAAKPLTRNGKSHMKLSLAAYSFHRYLPYVRWATSNSYTGKPKMTLVDFIDYCAELNLDGCELTGYYFPVAPPNDYLMHMKEQSFRLGLDISGTAIGNDFGLPEGNLREIHLAQTRKWIDYAALMGAPVIRIFAGRIPKGDTQAATIARCAEGINQSLDYAETKGVFLALENHGGITSTPAQMLKIIDAVKPSPYFGVNFDSGNFATPDPYSDLEQIAPYAINAQIKVEMHPGGRGSAAVPADLPRIIKILKNAHYRGYIVLEYEAAAEPKKTIPGYIEQLREIIHA